MKFYDQPHTRTLSSLFVFFALDGRDAAVSNALAGSFCVAKTPKSKIN
ncbi:MAG: hypothetical protein LBB72_03115 [Spirochaetaceae bacterium]|nr:hypothetical protein [Spirochaetaceae bacterium]